MLINDQNLEVLLTEAIAGFKPAYRAALAQFDHLTFTRELMTSGKLVDMSWLGNAAEFRKWVGGRIVRTFEAYKYTLTPVRWENTHGFQREEIDDANDAPLAAAKDINMAARMADIGSAAGLWHIVNATQALVDNNACHDGENFFATAHPNGTDGEATYGNIDTSGGVTNPWYLLDTRFSKPIIGAIRKAPVIEGNTSGDRFFDTGQFEVGGYARGVWGYGLPEFAYSSTAAVTLANVRAHIETMMAYVNDKGSRFAPSPNVLMVGRESRFAAEDLIKQKILSTGEENMAQHMGLQVVYNPFLP